MRYIQCEVRPKGMSAYDVVWLPEKFAKPGLTVDRKIRGTWSEGWQVHTVYNKVALSEDAVIDARDEYRHHRDNTDI